MRRIGLLIISLLVFVLVLSAQSAVFIEWEADETSVSGTVEIRGSVNPPGFQSYFLEAALFQPAGEQPALWLPITLPSIQAMENGVLGEWQTTILEDGVYQLRLHVVLNSGESIFYTIAPIAVNNEGRTLSSAPVSVLDQPGLVIMTATPSPIPPTNTPLPIPPTNTPGAAVLAPVGSSGVVPQSRLPIEVGGHVSGFNSSTQAAMRRAGMVWVKWQVPFRMGESTEVAEDRIRRSREAGFKVLLGITGEVSELQAMGDDYYPEYAAFLGRVAALNPDAIEVWNEMNIDREWPTGRISPNAYTSMLQQAYSAIKGANPNVLVISGALAPTGAEGAFGSSRVWNDDRYYQGMVNAGVANYADCIGVHYNEGILAPTQQGGDPRGEYPTRYLPLMLERVGYPFRNQGKPLCFTELGYLSGDGYPPLPGGFSWAASTSVAEQAEWLAGAIQVSANYNRVPVLMVIVWNVDFETYTDDPQAGYAIIRPDGSCPACDSIGALQR